MKCRQKGCKRASFTLSLPVVVLRTKLGALKMSLSTPVCATCREGMVVTDFLGDEAVAFRIDEAVARAGLGEVDYGDLELEWAVMR